MNDQALKNKIMRRIYGIWFVRSIVPKFAGATAFLWIGARIVADNFFVGKVIANFLNVAGSNMLAVPGFIGSALNHAAPSTLFLVSACGLAGFALSVKLLRTVRSLVAAKVTSQLHYQKW